MDCDWRCLDLRELAEQHLCLDWSQWRFVEKRQSAGQLHRCESSVRQRRFAWKQRQFHLSRISDGSEKAPVTWRDGAVQLYLVQGPGKLGGRKRQQQQQHVDDP